MTGLPVVAAATLTGADIRGLDIAGIRRALATENVGEVRFDTVSGADATDPASIRLSQSVLSSHAHDTI